MFLAGVFLRIPHTIEQLGIFKFLYALEPDANWRERSCTRSDNDGLAIELCADGRLDVKILITALVKLLHRLIQMHLG